MVQPKPEGQNSRSVALAIAATFAPAALAVAIGWCALDGRTLGIDDAILLAFRHSDNLGRPIGPPFLLDVMRDLTSLGSTTVTLLVMIVGAASALIMRRRGAALLLTASIGGGTAAVNLLKLAVGRVRPEIVPHLTSESTFSLPSSHAAMSALTFGTVAVLAARAVTPLRTLARLVAIVLPCAIGITRLYLGVHFPTDVLTGWLCGLVWLLLCVRLFGAAARRH